MWVYAGHRSPWDLLGLAPGCTEREVRSAYARALKVTRPDDDPVAFQRLVEARDFVLMMIREGIEPRFFEAEDEDDSESEEDDGEPIARPQALAPSEVEAERQPLTLQDIERPSVPNEGLAAEPEAEPNYRAVHDAAPTASYDRPPVEPTPGVHEAAHEAPAHEAVHQDLATEPEVDPTFLCAELTRRLTAGVSPDIVADWKQWIARVGRLDHDARNQLEPALLAVLPSLLPPIARLNAPVAPGPWVLRMLGRGLKPAEAAARALAAEQAEILVALDEEFGWTRFDRHVYARLGADVARLVLSKLSGLVQAAGIRRNGLPRRRNEQGIPQLDERDLRAYFGDTYSTFAAPYAAARLRDRWAPVWDTRRALLMPLQALRNRLWLPLAAWLSGLAFGVYLALLPDVQPAWLPLYSTAHPEVIDVVALTPLALAHIWYGFYGHVQHLDRATRTVIEADRRGLFQPEQRFAYIGRQGAAPRAKIAVTGGIPSYVWFLGIVILIRALAAFNQGAPQTPYAPPIPGIDLIQKYLEDAKRQDAGKIQAEEVIKWLRAGDAGDLSAKLKRVQAEKPKSGVPSPPSEPKP